MSLLFCDTKERVPEGVESYLLNEGTVERFFRDIVRRSQFSTTTIAVYGSGSLYEDVKKQLNQ